jgi:hypothetical protein
MLALIKRFNTVLQAGEHFNQYQYRELQYTSLLLLRQQIISLILKEFYLFNMDLNMVNNMKFRYLIP